MSFRVSGAEAMRNKLTRLTTRFPDEIERALYLEMQVELTEIRKRTPVDTNALRGSLHLEGPYRSGRIIAVDVVAGGPAALYAWFVHEDPDAYHPFGEWKYIERPLMESAPYMTRRIAARINLSKLI